MNDSQKSNVSDDTKKQKKNKTKKKKQPNNKKNNNKKKKKNIPSPKPTHIYKTVEGIKVGF